MTATRTTITKVAPLAERWIRLTFADGAVHEVDLSGLLQAGGVLAAIRDDRAVFEAAAVDPELGTIVWPGDVDLDPEQHSLTSVRRCYAARWPQIGLVVIYRQ